MNKVIYAISDIRNNKIIYIGQTKQFNERKRHHFKDNTQDIDKYITESGPENFSMYILEEIEDPNIKILDLENYYINKYDTINSGFNKHRSGGKQSKYNKEQTKLHKEEKKLINSDPDIKKQKRHQYYEKYK